MSWKNSSHIARHGNNRSKKNCFWIIKKKNNITMFLINYKIIESWNIYVLFEVSLVLLFVQLLCNSYHIYSFLSKLMNLTIKTKSFFNILVWCLHSQNCNIVKIEMSDSFYFNAWKRWKIKIWIINILKKRLRNYWYEYKK